MLECEVELIRDNERVQEVGVALFERVAMRFIERKRATWDHRKLGGVY